MPADRLYAPEQHTWVRIEADGSATVGATGLVTLHGQFMFSSPRSAGVKLYACAMALHEHRADRALIAEADGIAGAATVVGAAVEPGARTPVF